MERADPGASVSVCAGSSARGGVALAARPPVGFLVHEVEGHWRTSRQCHPSCLVKNRRVGILFSHRGLREKKIPARRDKLSRRVRLKWSRRDGTLTFNIRGAPQTGPTDESPTGQCRSVECRSVEWRSGPAIGTGQVVLRSRARPVSGAFWPAGRAGHGTGHVVSPRNPRRNSPSPRPSPGGPGEGEERDGTRIRRVSTKPHRGRRHTIPG